VNATVERAEEKYHWDKERGEARRPFRLWDIKHKKNVAWRYYSEPERAHNAALIEIRWSKIDAAIEVYDCRTGKLHGQYIRRVDSIYFVKG
jgi:hypothetical protein